MIKQRTGEYPFLWPKVGAIGEPLGLRWNCIGVERDAQRFDSRDGALALGKDAVAVGGLPLCLLLPLCLADEAGAAHPVEGNLGHPGDID